MGLCKRAPKRGHKSAATAARCPACHGLTFTPPPAPPGSTRQVTSVSGSSPRTVTTTPSPAAGAVPHRPPPGTVASSIDWGSKADKVLAPLVDVLSADDRAELRDALIDAAEELLPAGSGHPSHWLCELLAAIAKSLDPGTYIDALAEALEKGMIQNGVGRFRAKIVASAARKILKRGLDGLDPFATMRLYLWLLICMVCPAPDSCPTQPATDVEIIKADLAADSSD